MFITPPVINQCDVPSRYLRPYTRWVFTNLPKVGESLKMDPSAQEKYGVFQAFFQNTRSKSLGYYAKKEPEITAVAYYTAEDGGPCECTHREPGEPRTRGDKMQPNHLNVWVPPGARQSNTDKDLYLSDLKIKLYEVTVQIGAALGYFGREKLPGGPMPLHRQRVGKLWMEEADELLDAWKRNKRTQYDYDNPQYYANRQEP